MDETILDTCLDATKDRMVLNNREGYVRAVLKVLHIDPDADYDKYVGDIKGFGIRLCEWIEEKANG